MNILIVEDESKLANELESYLQKEAYLCKIVSNAAQASEEIFVNEYDIVLLDLGLPDKDGMEVLKEARKNGSEAAFIILTARGEVEDKVHGLNAGADDYLAKPFSLMELHSRILAITRRKHGIQRNIITIGDFEIDLQSRVVSHHGKDVNLTKREFDLLHYLVLHKNKVLTRTQLTEHIWGDILEEDLDSNYIDVHIKNLRKKLSTQGNCDWLITVRGIGYKVSPQ